MKTHRCKQLLESNKSHKNGKTICIQYGNPYPNFNICEIDWYLYCVNCDSEWESKYKSMIHKINYCPFCGEKLA